MAVPVGGKHDITVYEGAGFREEFELFQDDETTPDPFVVGSTGIAQIRTSEKTDARLLASFVVEISDNSLVITLPAEDTFFVTNLSSPVYYDIFVTEPEQEPVMFMEGKVRFNRAVTTPTP